jgi:molybdenum cofactor synthesis domain-containing protein
VVSVNLSEGKGTPKAAQPSVRVDAHGIVGDAHAGPWHRQVSLLAAETVEAFSRRHGREIAPGEFAENITTAGVDLAQVAPLDLIEAGDALLEVTQIGKACHGDTCAIFREVGACVMPKEGLFARVLRGETVAPGSPLAHRPRWLRVLVVTLSDRASRGDYEDRSGPRVAELLEDHFRESRWHLSVQRHILPDQEEGLRSLLRDARDGGVDVVVTTGSTGIGPRDIAPDVIRTLADKEIPGIMESIRVTCGASKPNALLSRSIAAALGETLVYAVPGSVKAVNEYLAEILKTLEHALLMLHGIGH